VCFRAIQTEHRILSLPKYEFSLTVALIISLGVAKPLKRSIRREALPKPTANIHSISNMSDRDNPPPDSSASDSPTNEEEPACSAIEELQSAFPSILVLKKDKNEVSRPINWQPWHDIVMEKRQAREARCVPLYPRWTGSFDILLFPRELRDNIYFHYLYRRKALIWRRRPNNGWERRDWVGYIAVYSPDRDQETLNLFLVSRQVYEEALYVFCRSNAVFVERRQHSLVQLRTLEGSLRLFPETSANMLQHVELRYMDYWRSESVGGWHGTSSSSTWAEITKDALVAKEFFPRLATYTALWEVDWSSFYDDEGMEALQSESVQDKTKMWLWWFRLQSKTKGVVPPEWVRVRLEPAPSSYYRWPENDADQGALRRALELFQLELRAKRVEKRDELEDSGKKWLENEWGDGRRVRKGKGKSAV